MKTNINCHGDEVIDFYDKKIPKLDFNHTCLAVVILDSAPQKRWQLSSASVFKRV